MLIRLLSAGGIGLATIAALVHAGLGPEGICRNTVTFTQVKGSPFVVGPMAGRPVIADMNADGKPDIVLACGTCCGSKPSPESGHVVVLLSDGQGSFTESGHDRIKVGPSVRKIAVADVNSDGAPDVLCAEHDSYNVTILLNDRKGGLVSGGFVVAASGKKAHTHEIAAADMNGDGKVDVLTTNANDNSISVLLGNGKGGFTPAEGSPFPTGGHPYDALAIGDVNGDSKPDVVVPFLQRNRIGVLIGDGKGGLTVTQKYEVDARPGYVALTDINGDKKLDIVATHDDVGVVDVLLGDGTGNFAFAHGYPAKLDSAVWGIAAADMNADAKTDLVLGQANGRDVVVAFGDGSGRFSQAACMSVKADDWPNYVAVADMNADGKPDIVTGNYKNGTVSVLVAK